MASNKERVAKCRAKQKADSKKWELVKKKDKERKIINRAAEKTKGLDEKSLQIRRNSGRLRSLKCREKKKALIAVTPPKKKGFKGKAGLTKALKKVYNSLPKSPSKKKEVLKRMFKDSAGRVLYSEDEKSSRGRKPMDGDTQQKVAEFFRRDDISWQAPGKRDTVSVKDPTSGKRTSIQKRFMTMGIAEAKKVFDEENADSTLSLSKFFELRPKYVLPVSKTPHNVCVCVVHANFLFMVKAIVPYLDSQNEVKDYKTLMTETICDSTNENCMSEKCSECKEFNVNSFVKLDVSRKKKISYRQWTKSEGRLQVIESTETLDSFITKFNEAFSNFKTHHYVKNTQSQHFESLKKSIKKGEAVIQVDFAENASLIAQDEIQSAHWCHGQVTLFTCVIWTPDKTYSFVVLSDDLTHSKESVWTFLKAIIRAISFQVRLVRFYLFSDNCAAQFRSKFTAANLCFLANDFDVETVTLDTFAAGHGKGAVDAIGGLVKRTVWVAVKARKLSVSTPEEYYKCALEQMKTTVTILYVPKSDVEASAPFLNARWSTVKKLTGIQQLHHFERKDSTHITAALTSKSKKKNFLMFRRDQTSAKLDSDDVYTDSEGEDDILEEITENDISPGVFIKIQLTSQNRRSQAHNFLGICQSDVNMNNQLRVLFLIKHGSNELNIYKTNERDEKYVSFCEVVQIVPQPKMNLVGNRIYYQFSSSVNLK